jgi:hypothetical protein
MDIYIDRTIEFGQKLPPGAPDFQLALSPHAFHVVEPGHPIRSVPVRLRAAVYCGVTDVLQFVAEVIPEPPAATTEEPDLRWVKLSELMLAPLSALPRLAFDTERLNGLAHPAGSREARPMTPDQARALGLSWQATDDGGSQVKVDPDAPARLLAGVQRDDRQLRLTVATSQGRPSTGVAVGLDELTRDARRAALALMDERHAALADIDSLQGLQPALRAISRARNGHRERADPATVQRAIERHRERARHELDQLLLALKQP